MRRPAAAAALLLLTACAESDSSGTPADRTVTISATDALKFEPSTVTAKVGEKVRFRIVNAGALRHEFVIGAQSFHDEHASASPGADQHGGHGGDDKDGKAVDVPAGKTVTLDFVMPASAPKFACYVDKHHLAGMTGTVTYS